MTITSDFSARSTRQIDLNLIDRTMEGAGQIAAEIYRRLSPGQKFFITITDKADDSWLSDIVKENNSVPDTPMIFLKKTDVSRLSDYTNPYISKEYGVRMGLTQDRAHTLMLHAYPCLLNVTMSLLTVDKIIHDTFVRAILMERERVEFGIDINDPKFSFDIRMAFPDSITYSDRQKINDTITGYRLDLTVAVRSYVAMVERVPNLARIDINPLISKADDFNNNLDNVRKNANNIGPETDFSNELSFSIDLRKYATTETLD